MTLCAFRDALGQPGKGIHQYRLGPFAFVDLLLTLLLAFLLCFLTGASTPQNVLVVFILLFVVGEIFHVVFCVDTAFICLIKDCSQDISQEISQEITGCTWRKQDS